MDRTGIIVVSTCVALLIAWFIEEQKQAAQTARWQQQQAQFAKTNQIAAAQEPGPAAESKTIFPQIFNTNAPENLVVISNADARYTFTSRGGGLKSVELLKYHETISPRWKKEMAANGMATLNTRAPVPVLAVLGDPSLMGDGNFTLTKTNDDVWAQERLTNGLVVTKEFHVSSNYLINARVRFENNSGKSLALPAQEFVVGTATPMGPDDSSFSTYGGAMWFNGKSPQNCTASYFNTNTTVLFLFSRTPKTEYRAGADNVTWAAVHNQFFAIVAMPATNQPAQQIVARPVSLPPFSTNGFALPTIGIQTALIYPAQTLAANGFIGRQIVFYAGPKEYRTLARVGAEFQNHADEVMNFGTGYAGFFGIGSFCAKALLLAMNWIHDVTRLGYGWAIVLLTILLRGIFWPLTAASTRSMKRMQALAPEVKALKEKYKDEPQKFTQKQMELWKKNKVNPMGGCLPMLVQMPVFLGFFTMIRSAIELRGAHFLWVSDLSKPDTLFMIPGFDFPFNLLPLLMVAVMIWQAHLQPASPGMDPGQQKMMRYMPLIFLVILYNYSAGMALYMTASTLMGILQTRLTKMNQSPAAVVVVSPLTPPSKKKK